MTPTYTQQELFAGLDNFILDADLALETIRAAIAGAKRLEAHSAVCTYNLDTGEVTCRCDIANSITDAAVDKAVTRIERRRRETAVIKPHKRTGLFKEE